MPEYVGVPPQFDVAPKTFFGAWTFYVDLVKLTASMDVVTDFKPGFDGEIVKLCFVTATPQVDANKAATLKMQIGDNDVTGGLISLITTGTDTLGELTGGTDVVSGNGFVATDVITVRATVSVAFTQGMGTLWVLYAGKL